MNFGYFTLSDNHYANNPRSPNRLVADIIDEALYAETVGLHSVWIGEHHFSTLGVLSCPDLALAYIAARTQRACLAPAVIVLPCIIPSVLPNNGQASTWARQFRAGRGYDRREYAPLGVSFENNPSIFEEGMEIVQRLWSAGGANVTSRPALCLRRCDDHAVRHAHWS